MAPLTLAIRDETTAGTVLAELDLQLAAETVTVAQIIEARVAQEVRAHNAKARPGRFFGLVQPSDDERLLNGPPRARWVDAERQTVVALDAFRRGHVLVLVDDSQVSDLHHEVTLGPDSSVVFLRLVPLVGG